MIPVAQLLAEGGDRLRRAGIETHRLEARRLLAFALGAENVAPHSDAEATAEAAARFAALVARRLAGEPVSRILGRREFWSLSFEISPATLDPRPDSETLIEAALEIFPDKDRGIAILDFGTGSGCLLLAALSEFPKARGLGVDLSADALAVAAANARALGLADRARFQTGDWDRGLTGHYDLILANPPYIAEGEIAGLAPEVRDFDPMGALAAGPDGLQAYRALMPAIRRRLAAGGQALVELGAGQAEKVAALARAAGLEIGGTKRDLAGIERCLRLHLPA